MKTQRVSTRRKPVRKTFSAKLFGKSKTRKHKATAAAPMPANTGNDESSFSRSLTIIFVIHVVAIAMIVIHKQYLSGRTAEPSKISQNEANSRADRSTLPVLSDGSQPYLVQAGDSFADVASHYKVTEKALREANQGVEKLKTGLILRIPEAKQNQDNSSAITQSNTGSTEASNTDGLVSVASSNSNDAQGSEAAPPVAVALKVHKVQPGETIWRIARKYKVSQASLLEVNNISDPSKIRVGQVLNLPAK